jgi:hypothetical protein
VLRTIAILLAIAIALVGSVGGVGYWSCEQLPEQQSEAAKAEEAREKHCSTIGATFKFGKAEVGEILHSYHDEINALSTVVIAILGLFTISLSRSTRIAAYAAKDSADAILAAERARFFIVIEKHNLSRLIGLAESQGNMGGDGLWITYRFKNYGKTPGIIRELVIESMIATEPVEPVTTFLAIREFPEYMIAANDSTEPTNYGPSMQPALSQVQAIGRNHARLWFFGRLYYDDVFGNPQLHRFYFRSARIDDECILQPYDYKDYNKST